MKHGILAGIMCKKLVEVRAVVAHLNRTKFINQSFVLAV